MTIKAKFQSNCTKCHKTVFVNELIEWTPGVKGVQHTSCPQAKVEFNQTARENLDEAILAIREMHEDEPAYRTYDGDDFAFDAWSKVHQGRIAIRPISAKIGTDADDRSYDAWLAHLDRLDLQADNEIERQINAEPLTTDDLVNELDAALAILMG